MKIYNQFLNSHELQELDILLSRPKWGFTGSSNGNLSKKFWNMDLTNEPFILMMLKRLELFTEKKYEVERIYANGHTIGQNGDFHTDSNIENAMTFLYYYIPSISNDEMDDYGGYTQFKKENTIICIEPKHNSGVLFKASLLHRGLAPFKREYGLRITIAFKLKEI